MTSVKVVVVGDGAVGKTCLITAYCEDRFPTDYIPTVSDTYEGPTEYEGKEVALKIWDTAGQHEFKAVRPVAYNDADCFVVCFDLSKKETLENACNAWKKELVSLGPRNCPKVLCGTKKDLRDHKMSKGENLDELVSEKDGNAAAEDFKFFGYVECSAKLFENCGAVFFEAIRAAEMMRAEIGKQPTKESGCSCSTF